MSSTALKAMADEISSLEATSQVVHAFELLAMVHLPALRAQVEAVRAYTDAVLHSIAEIAEHGELRYSVEAEGRGHRDLVILVTSSMGMCGSYNQEVFAALEKHLAADGDESADEAEYLVIGSRGMRHLTDRKRSVLGLYDLDLEGVDVTTVAGLAAAAVDRVRSGHNRRVLVAYTHYEDVVTFSARVAQLYPLHLPPHREPDANLPVVDFELEPAEVLAQFVDSYAIGQLFAWVRHAVASEYGMRRMTTNLSKRALRDTLTERRRHYRKARMAAESAELLDVLSSQQAARTRRTTTGARDD
ncbi:FoF1 ATP synthase subunit gamma [Pengzhenrongella phosphoraccumulans]|uniref:F0F1 ATP synthase subunit gamma n=1 Tax=Pengzhenrongella phosphoraccumulans TaxID=3114394 RepID=UPI0038900BDC